MGDEQKKKRSAFALPKTSAVEKKESPPPENTSADPVRGLEQSFTNCLDQLKVWGLETHIDI